MGMKTRNRIGLRTHFVNPLDGLILLFLLTVLAGCGSSSDTQSAVREAQSFGITATITSPSGNVVIAPGSSITFSANASGGSGTYTFNWDTPGATTPNTTGSPSGDVTYNKEGVFTVTLSAVDDRGNTARDAVNVTVSSSQLLTLLAQITSPTQSVTIAEGGSVSFAGQGIGGSGDYQYGWTFSGGTPSSSSAQAPGDVIFSGTGSRVVRFTVTDSRGSSATDSVVIKVGSAAEDLAASITSPAADLTLSNPATVNFSGRADGGSAPYSYRWDIPGGSVRSSTSQSVNNVVFNNDGVYRITLTVTDARGRTASDTVTLTVTTEALNAQITSPSGGATVSQFDTVSFASSVSGGSGTYTYNWDIQGGTPATATTQNTSSAFNTTGVYAVTVTVTDSAGNTSTDTVTITVQ